MCYNLKQTKILNENNISTTATSSSTFISKNNNKKIFFKTNLRAKPLFKLTYVSPVSVFTVLALLLFVYVNSTPVSASSYIQDEQNSIQLSELSPSALNNAASLYLRFRKGNPVEQPRKFYIV